METEKNTEKLTPAHLLDPLASFVGLLRLPAAHVHAVSQDVAHGARGFLEAACWEKDDESVKMNAEGEGREDHVLPTPLRALRMFSVILNVTFWGCLVEFESCRV